MVELSESDNQKFRITSMIDCKVVLFDTKLNLVLCLAICMAMAYERGWLNYQDKICQHWPEFAQKGKVG